MGLHARIALRHLLLVKVGVGLAQGVAQTSIGALMLSIEAVSAATLKALHLLIT